MKKPRISAIITTFNEQRHIGACIESLLWCDEILVVDSFSTDHTIEIVRKYESVRLMQRVYFGAASQKNWAMDQVTGDWILIFDADERCTAALRREIEALFDPAPRHEAYTIRRRVTFLGKVLRYSGWQNERVVRLLKRGAGRYQNRRVHPKLLTRRPAPLLREPMDHLMTDSLDEYMRRIAKYSYWGAAQAFRDGRTAGILEVFGRPMYRFIRTYIIQFGFLEGMRGLVFCMLQAYGAYLKWATVWGWNYNQARGIPPALPAFDEDPDTWKGLELLERTPGHLEVEPPVASRAGDS